MRQNSTQATRPISFLVLQAVVTGSLLAACSSKKGVEHSSIQAPPPLASLDGSAYATAARYKLPEAKPIEEPGLHNVFRLSDDIISGSEPHGEEAFAELHRMGVKTILSVDGKVPDEALAKKYGMTYVHVPIQYKGIADDEMLRIAKTFREKNGPFYVHCFHGKHRGPAAAEVGRLVLDGISREQGLAEMRQCGTAESYEGLYLSIAEAEIPSATETQAYAWNFPAAHPLKGFRHSMIDVSRADDNLKALSKHKWAPDDEHPDVDAVNEAAKLASTLERSAKLPEVGEKPADFRKWMAESVTQSATLRDALTAWKAGTGSVEGADTAYKALTATCNACHGVYRNE